MCTPEHALPCTKTTPSCEHFCRSAIHRKQPQNAGISYRHEEARVTGTCAIYLKHVATNFACGAIGKCHSGYCAKILIEALSSLLESAFIHALYSDCRDRDILYIGRLIKAHFLL